MAGGVFNMIVHSTESEYTHTCKINIKGKGGVTQKWTNQPISVLFFFYFICDGIIDYRKTA